MRETEGGSKSAACCSVRAQEFIYISFLNFPISLIAMSYWWLTGGDDFCAGSGLAMLVAAEFGGGGKMCEDFYFYYFS